MDVWTALGVKKPSVSIAFRKLASGNLIRVHENHEVDLTENGYAIASKINDSYVTFKQFLCSIGVPEEVAEHDACRIEHYLSPESRKGIRGIMTRTAE